MSYKITFPDVSTRRVQITNITFVSLKFLLLNFLEFEFLVIRMPVLSFIKYQRCSYICFVIFYVHHHARSEFGLKSAGLCDLPVLALIVSTIPLLNILIFLFSFSIDTSHGLFVNDLSSWSYVPHLFLFIIPWHHDNPRAFKIATLILSILHFKDKSCFLIHDFIDLSYLLGRL